MEWDKENQNKRLDNKTKGEGINMGRCEEERIGKA